MSRIPFWRIIVFGRHGIVLPGQAEPRQIMLNRNSVKLNSTFLRIQEEPPPKSGGLLFCAAGAKVIGCFFQMFENLTHVLCESASIRSFQVVGPEAGRSHRNWKRYTPLRHVPERILPYTLCLRWFLCNRRCNKSSNRLNVGLFGGILPCLVLLQHILFYPPACLFSRHVAAVLSST